MTTRNPFQHGDGAPDYPDYGGLVSEVSDLDDLSERVAAAIRKHGASAVNYCFEDARALAEGRAIIDMNVDGGLPLVDFARWQGEPPERQFLWGTLLPLRQTTMLTGPGGVGKSLLAQQLATHAAVGASLLGIETVQCKTLYITCEDDTDELWRRQHAICENLGRSIHDLGDSLFLVSLCGAPDTALATFKETGEIIPSARWRQLEADVLRLGIGLIIFDNVTDAMAGDLNDIHQVAEFVNLTTGLAIRAGAAFMMLHHPNKAGEEWLGSVAWHNKVRSRLVMKRGETAGDADLRMLSNPKANYGPSGSDISFRWYAGTFMTDEAVPSTYFKDLAESAQAASDNALFLACLRQRTKEQRAVSAAPSATFAPTEFTEMNQSKGIGRERLKLAMNRLFALGVIETGELSWQRTDRHRAKGIREVAGNASDPPKNITNVAGDAAGDARQTPAGNAGDANSQQGQVTENVSGRRDGLWRQRHPSSYGGEGVASNGWPAPSSDDLDYGGDDAADD